MLGIQCMCVWSSSFRSVEEAEASEEGKREREKKDERWRRKSRNKMTRTMTVRAFGCKAKASEKDNAFICTAINLHWLAEERLSHVHVWVSVCVPWMAEWNHIDYSNSIIDKLKQTERSKFLQTKHTAQRWRRKKEKIPAESMQTESMKKKRQTLPLCSSVYRLPFRWTLLREEDVVQRSSTSRSTAQQKEENMKRKENLKKQA